jgi:uncharacterized protein YukE
MATGRIVGTPAQLMELKGVFDQQSQALQNVVSTVNSRLQIEWEGQRRNRFMETWQEYQRTLQSLQNELNEVGNEAHKAGQDLQAAGG